ncbi:MAG: hypothetical protein ACR2PT_01405 [Endozoicomonas sp.]
MPILAGWDFCLELFSMSYFKRLCLLISVLLLQMENRADDFCIYCGQRIQRHSIGPTNVCLNCSQSVEFKGRALTSYTEKGLSTTLANMLSTLLQQLTTQLESEIQEQLTIHGFDADILNETAVLLTTLWLANSQSELFQFVHEHQGNPNLEAHIVIKIKDIAKTIVESYITGDD